LDQVNVDDPGLCVEDMIQKSNGLRIILEDAINKHPVIVFASGPRSNVKSNRIQAGYKLDSAGVPKNPKLWVVLTFADELHVHLSVHEHAL
jgi:hypothetical protein